MLKPGFQGCRGRRDTCSVLVALILWLGALALAGCASTGPAPVSGWNGQGPVPRGYYRVRADDSLSKIAVKRRVSVENLIRWNAIKPPYTIYTGKLLRVVPVRSPGGARGAKARTKPRVARTASGTATATASGQGVSGARAGAVNAAPAAPTVPGGRGNASGVTWAWPLNGAILQGFRGDDPSRQGLRISCRPGEEVHAAAAGQVVYSGSGLKGYGNLIIVKHNQKYLSAYGFNRRLLLKDGDRAERGQTLSECGEGPDGAALLHFEVRRDGASVDPILYLPPRE